MLTVRYHFPVDTSTSPILFNTCIHFWVAAGKDNILVEVLSTLRMSLTNDHRHGLHPSNHLFKAAMQHSWKVRRNK